MLSRKIKPEKGDIIFPRYGTIGKNVLVDTDKKFLISYSCAIIKPNTNLINEKYIYLFSLSPKVTDEIRKYVDEKLHSSKLILAAEDSGVAREVLASFFEETGLDYEIYTNGTLLVKRIEELNPDKIGMVITDIEMPEMSGFTVIQHLKANPQTKSIPIIVNSSMTGDNNKREASSLGADGFIDKTKSENILALIVEKMGAESGKLLPR